MKGRTVMLVAFFTFLACQALAAEVKKAVVLESDHDISEFATRVGLSVDQLVQLNPQLKTERTDREGSKIQPFQLSVGEGLIVSEPSASKPEPPAAMPAAASTPAQSEQKAVLFPKAETPVEKKMLSPHLGLGVGVGSTERSDYLFEGIWAELPWTDWLSSTFGFAQFKSTDRDYLASGDTNRWDSGLALKTEHFVSESKIGQDYNPGQGASRGVNLTQSFQFGLWRFWNEAVLFTNTSRWPFWTRDRLKLALYRGFSAFSLGGEYLTYGWKNEDPNLPNQGYYYTSRGAGFLQWESGGVDHPYSILVGGGSSDLRAMGEGGASRRYYLLGEFTIKFF